LPQIVGAGVTAHFFHTLTECVKTIGKEINIASNTEISMADTLNLIKEIMQSDVQFASDEQSLEWKTLKYSTCGTATS
jgi:hypothetical protein